MTSVIVDNSCGFYNMFDINLSVIEKFDVSMLTIKKKKKFCDAVWEITQELWASNSFIEGSVNQALFISQKRKEKTLYNQIEWLWDLPCAFQKYYSH